MVKWGYKPLTNLSVIQLIRFALPVEKYNILFFSFVDTTDVIFVTRCYVSWHIYMLCFNNSPFCSSLLQSHVAENVPSYVPCIFACQYPSLTLHLCLENSPAPRQSSHSQLHRKCLGILQPTSDHLCRHHPAATRNLPQIYSFLKQQLETAALDGDGCQP